jgi:hypothetical protein
MNGMTSERSVGLGLRVAQCLCAESFGQVIVAVGISN